MINLSKTLINETMEEIDILKINNMLYCVRVYRGGIGEEDVVDHVEFDHEPSLVEIIEFIEEMDCGYDPLYCKFDYFLVSK